MSKSDPTELYALRSPLSVQEAVERLTHLGRVTCPARTPGGLIEVELADPQDPLSAVVGVQIEARPRGSYVTARVCENGFLRDFARVVRAVLSLYAVAVALFACSQLTGGARGLTLAGIALGWCSLMMLLAAGVRLISGRSATELPRLRLRHQLARLMHR